MTKNNQLFEAIGCIDDAIAERAINSIEQKKRKKPITLIAIAAAAAVLSLIVGFASKNGEYERFDVTFQTNNSPKRGFTTTITEHHFTIPEEFETMCNRYGHLSGHLEMLPNEVFEKFGLTMLTSENFSETKDVKMKYVNEYDEVIATWEPNISGDEKHVEIRYPLYDKNIGTNVWIEAVYIADMETCIIMGLGDYHFADQEADIVTLNDGSLAMVSDTDAAFCYDGVGYRLRFDDYKNESAANIDNMKQVLADLNLYTPAD